jgi:hypothetical protein
MSRLTVLFILIHSPILVGTRRLDSLAPEAIKAVIDEYFSNNVREIEIFNFGDENGKTKETIDKISRLGNHSIPVTITLKRLISDNLELNKSSILLFDSPENFRTTQDWIVFHHHGGISHTHLIYIHKASMNDLEIVSNRNQTIDKVIFLVNETLHSISLAAAFLFTPEACWINQFKVINRFTRGPKRWRILSSLWKSTTTFTAALFTSIYLVSTFQSQ